jgi:hypothetical protein
MPGKRDRSKVIWHRSEDSDSKGFIRDGDVRAQDESYRGSRLNMKSLSAGWRAATATVRALRQTRTARRRRRQRGGRCFSAAARTPS